MCILNHDATGSNDPDRKAPATIGGLKFWEVEHFFRCPIVGMCLNPAERRQVLKKCGFDLKGKSPYAIHEILVAGAESQNRLSRRVDGMLDRKYGRCVTALHHLPEADFMALWKTAFSVGDYLAALWAAATRRNLSITARREIFGAIHMRMHENGDQASQAARRLAHLSDAVETQAQKIKALSQERRTLRKENEAVKVLLAEVRGRLQQLELENERLRTELSVNAPLHPPLALEQELRCLKATLADQASRLARQDRQLRAQAEQLDSSARALAAQKEAEALLRRETQAALGSFLAMNRCDTDCPAFDLCRKRVLIVGGITRMEALYRRLVEENGGVFEYHDGYMKGGARQLESRLKRSDIVLCPVNCNSHAACAMIKNLGKKHNKPVHMLANFSLSTVFQVIRNCGGGRN